MDRNSLTKASAAVLRVALRKESVDRNDFKRFAYYGKRRSLSARRAWIEIGTSSSDRSGSTVALRKESVDRNRHKFV